ncbi:MAG: precorrin-6Y C5,15-methyltransferase (decarboxylating) subunit CbiT [Micrococcales bacterium]|nr:precorrin-6Y C5,15-methyltransferase (decarboxylating) subunit CbiT [Micrococcales bacterium]
MIEVVGVGADGVAGLPERLRRLVNEADALISSPRLLATLPAAEPGAADGQGQQRIEWPRPLVAGLPALLETLADKRIAVLATGDPLVAGIGSTLIRLLGPDTVRIHPAPSSLALARAELRWPVETVVTHSLVSADPVTVRPLLTPGARLLLLSAGAHTPAQVARLLVEDDWADARVTVLGDLGSVDQSRWEGTASAAAEHTAYPALSITAVELSSARGALGTSPGLPDDAFEHLGQITKREVRAAALAALRPMPGQHLWDLGAGVGSIAVEWALQSPTATASAVERLPDRADLVEANSARLGATGVTVVREPVADALAALPDPDAVFVGGGASAEVIEEAWRRLRPGGRLVAHAVTLETEALLVDAWRAHGGELRRVSIERAEPLGRYLSWTPARPIVQWAATKTTPDAQTSEESPA